MPIHTVGRTDRAKKTLPRCREFLRTKTGGLLLYLHSRVCVSYPSLPLPTMDGWMDAGGKKKLRVSITVTAVVEPPILHDHFPTPFAEKKVCSNDDEKLSPPLVLWLVCLSSFLPLPFLSAGC